MVKSFFINFCFNSGYMSPEYAMDGLFSVKSDVYSFGVLVLEIITGKKNTSYVSNYVNLIGQVSKFIVYIIKTYQHQQKVSS